MPPTLITARAMLLQGGAMAAPRNAILGLWRTDDGKALVEIARCGDMICGHIARVIDRGPSVPATDVNNPDDHLRARPTVGLSIFYGFTWRSDKASDGRAYVDKGYRGHSVPHPRRVFISGQKRGVHGVIQRELAAPIRHRTGDRTHEDRRPSRPKLPQGLYRRSRQRPPHCRRPQLPAHPRMAQASLAPVPRNRRPLPRAVTNVQKRFLTVDESSQLSTGSFPSALGNHGTLHRGPERLSGSPIKSGRPRPFAQQ